MKKHTPTEYRTAFAHLSKERQDLIGANDTYERASAIINQVLEQAASVDVEPIIDSVLYDLCTRSECQEWFVVDAKTTAEQAQTACAALHTFATLGQEDGSNDALHPHTTETKPKAVQTPAPAGTGHAASNITDTVRTQAPISTDLTSATGTAVDPVSEQLTKLPMAVRSVIESAAIEDAFRNIVVKHALTKEQATNLKQHTMKAVTGLEKTDDYKVNVTKDAHLDPQKLALIFQDVEQQIFKPVRDALVQAVQEKKQSSDVYREPVKK